MAENTKTLAVSTDAMIDLIVEYPEPIEATRVYGLLLDLDYRSDEYYVIDDPRLEITGFDKDEEFTQTYTIRMSISKLPESKMAELIALLVRPD